MLFLALKKIQLVKTTPCQIATSWLKIPQQNFPFPPLGKVSLTLNTICKNLFKVLHSELKGSLFRPFCAFDQASGSNLSYMALGDLQVQLKTY